MPPNQYNNSSQQSSTGQPNFYPQQYSGASTNQNNDKQQPPQANNQQNQNSHNKQFNSKNDPRVQQYYQSHTQQQVSYSNNQYSQNSNITNQVLPQNPVGQPNNQVAGNSVNPGQNNSKNNPQTKQKRATDKSTTQKSLLFSEIRDNMMIMVDGGFRAVIECESINFDLMSERERDGIEYSYKNFLNSLYFSIQILIRSERIDIAPYIEKLENIRRKQDNMLLNVLMDDYMDFIEDLAYEANIMDKKFYIAIPYSATADPSQVVEKSKGFFSAITGQPKQYVTKIDKKTYEKTKSEVKNRVDLVLSGLSQIGVHAKQLNTRQISELLYNIYNPDTTVRDQMNDNNDMHNQALYVRKGERKGGMNG